MRGNVRRQISRSPFSLLVCTRVIRALRPRLLLILPIPILLGGLLQACGGGGGGPAPSNIKAITIDPINPSLAHGTQIQLHATANFKNGTTRDVTESATWSSANSAVANVSNSAPTKGLSSGAGVGATTVTARFRGTTGTATFMVTNATLQSIIITPDPTIAKGTSVQLIATGIFSDGSTQILTNQVTWSSGNSGIATVSPLGLVTGVSAGSTPITGTLQGVSGSTTATVNDATLTAITVSPANQSIPKGTTLQLTATGTFNDGTTEDLTTQVTWTSSAQAVATVSNVGVVSGLSLGPATITATMLGMPGSTTVTVDNATLTSMLVVPANVSIPAGLTEQLFAVGSFNDGTTHDLTTEVGWEPTPDPNPFAHVSNEPGSQGLVTGLAAGGPLTITATPPTNLSTTVSGSTKVTVTSAKIVSIAVTPANPSIVKGGTIQLVATATLSDNTHDDITETAAWTVSVPSPPAIVTVGSGVGNNPGLVTGVAAGGPVTITAADVDTHLSGSTMVTVTPAEFAYVTSTATPGTITIFSVNQNDGTLTQQGLPVADPGQPSAIAVNPSGTFLYTSNRQNLTVNAFAITPSGGLTPEGSQTLSTSPSGLVVDPSGNFVYVATGSQTAGIAVFAITPGTGALTPITPTNTFPVTGLFTGPAGIAVHPTDQFIYTPGSVCTANCTTFFPITAGALGGYIFDSTTGAILGTVTGSPVVPSMFEPPTPFTPVNNIQPTLDPLGEHLFVPNTNANNVLSFVVGDDGALNFVPPAVSLEAGPPPFNPASIAVDSSSQFAYVLGFGGFIQSFAIKGGTLEPIHTEPAPTSATNLIWVTLDPSGKFVYVAPQGGVSGYEITKGTGNFTPIGQLSPTPPNSSAIAVVAVP